MTRYEIALGKKPPQEKEKSLKYFSNRYIGSWDIADVSNKFDSMVNIADVDAYLGGTPSGAIDETSRLRDRYSANINLSREERLGLLRYFYLNRPEVQNYISALTGEVLRSIEHNPRYHLLNKMASISTEYFLYGDVFIVRLDEFFGGEILNIDRMRMSGGINSTGVPVVEYYHTTTNSTTLREITQRCIHLTRQSFIDPFNPSYGTSVIGIDENSHPMFYRGHPNDLIEDFITKLNNSPLNRGPN
jgi:hypothetical protein